MKNKKFIISFTVFIISIILLVSYFIYNKKSYHQPEIASNIIEEDTIIETVKEENLEKEETEKKLKEINDLYKKNNDLVGWLEIDNTTTSYPVMYTSGEDYYLYRDFYKKYYKPGSLYVDKNNEVSRRDINLIIHGHNMKNGTMFGLLPRYKKEDYYKEHKTFTFYTLDEKQEYEVIAVFLSKIYTVIDDEYKYYKFLNTTDEEEYNEYIDFIKENSLYDIELSAKYPEELITLSTCDYTQTNGRLVIVGKRIK